MYKKLRLIWNKTIAEYTKYTSTHKYVLACKSRPSVKRLQYSSWFQLHTKSMLRNTSFI